ncbi:MAG: hypothetical protein ACTSRZ_02295 [Promethearchaeota archaeon]
MAKEKEDIENLKDFSNIADYSSLTCANLKIHMELRSKKLQKGEFIEFLCSKPGAKTLQEAFLDKPFEFILQEVEPFLFYVKIIKK